VDPDKPAKNFEGLREIQTYFDSDEKSQEMKVNSQWYLSIEGWDSSETRVYTRVRFEDWQGREKMMLDLSQQPPLGGRSIRWTVHCSPYAYGSSNTGK
jgi:hypothetical protein